MKRPIARKHKSGWRQIFYAHVKARSYHYWTTATLVFILSIVASPFVYDKLGLGGARAYLFQKPFDWWSQGAASQKVSLVLIGDEEFWRGELAGRRPVKRDYLARIVGKLVEVNAKVIALDFDERLPDPASPTLPNDYKAETDKLIAAIKGAAMSGVKVVLATPVTRSEGRYWRDHDIYQINDLCQGGATQAAAESDPIRENITCGYIALPYDPLFLPNQLRLGDMTCLDAFGLAIARAKDKNSDAVKKFSDCQGPATRYTNFIPPDKFAKVSAGTLLTADLKPLRKDLEGKIVIVGGDWFSFAAGRGLKVDQHLTPVGLMDGATLHANYVEAFLGSRTVAETPVWALYALELMLGVGAAVLFAGLPNFWLKLFGIVAVVAFLIAVEWVLLLERGVFFDPMLPIVGLGLHSLYDRLFEPSLESG